VKVDFSAQPPFWPESEFFNTIGLQLPFEPVGINGRKARHPASCQRQQAIGRPKLPFLAWRFQVRTTTKSKANTKAGQKLKDQTNLKVLSCI
jgi:hypothetical protein